MAQTDKKNTDLEALWGKITEYITGGSEQEVDSSSLFNGGSTQQTDPQISTFTIGIKQLQSIVERMATKAIAQIIGKLQPTLTSITAISGPFVEPSPNLRTRDEASTTTDQ